MTITVIVCTYNRCETLKRALESIATSVVPSSVVWEVLVVDNNSTDHTRRVVEEFSCRHPNRFHYLLESQQGKSYALNSAIREARGEILAFTDDDVIVEPSWLYSLTDPLCARRCIGAGGRVLPEQTFTPPRWLSLGGQFSLAPLSLFDRGPEAKELQEAPFGNNMAFRKEAFEKYGGFRTDLGPRPDSEIRNEDTEFGVRLLTAGERLQYEPSAVVYHSVPECRIEREFFLAWWFDKGRADIRQVGICHDLRWQIMGVPLCYFRRLMRWTIQWLFTIDPARRFMRKVCVWCVLGQIVEYYDEYASAV